MERSDFSDGGREDLNPLSTLPQTLHFSDQMRRVAKQANGSPTRLGLEISHDALLRLMQRSESSVVTAPRMLGLDDFAWEKGC